MKRLVYRGDIDSESRVGSLLLSLYNVHVYRASNSVCTVAMQMS